jgi:CHAD domain-containing protein
MAGKIPRPTLVAHVIAVDIWAHYASVSAFGAVLPCASVETLHALRTECKGLRYLLEFFGEALDPCIEEAIEAIVAVQDHLGELQDAIVTIEFVRAFLAEPAAVASHEVTTAARRYLESRQSRIENLRSCVDRPWMGVSDRGFKACLARATASL